MTKAQAQAWPARRLPAEWEPAGAVLLAWPRADGDWAPYLEDVRACYRRLLAALSALAPVLLLVDEPERVLLELGPELASLTRQPFSPPGPASANGSGAGGAAASGPSTTGSASGEPITGALAAPRLRLLASPARDTWTRDYGPITVLERQLEPPTTATGARLATAPWRAEDSTAQDSTAQDSTARESTAGQSTAGATTCRITTAGMTATVAATATRAATTSAVARPGSRHEQPLLLDFSFNGWGGKYASAGDDAATAALHASGALGPVPLERQALVLEGGSIESDGLGTLLTTSTCLLAPSRNPQLDPSTLEAELKRLLGVERVLWLEQEALAGDDTDAHIDTLVRFCPNDTLVYVQGEPIAPLADSAARERDAGSHGGSPIRCGERRTPAAHPRDGHGQPGAAPPESLLERQLRALRTAGGQPYRLVALPPGPPRHAPDDGRPLPATYANALFLNGSVLLPVYGDPERDADAVAAWRQACPEWRIQAIDCSALLLQHGSLHCATMQIPAAVFG